MIDIVHVGLHKTGSTWLQRAVFPDCETHHYLDDRRRLLTRHIVNPDESSSARVQEFLEAHPGGVLWSCEDLSGLFLGSSQRARIVELLAAHLRDAGVIVVVRSQSTLLPSLYAQYVKQGGTRSFARFLEGDCPGFPFDLDDLHYDSLIAGFVERFGRSRVLILPYELLLRDRTRFLARLSSFCGESFSDHETLRLNPSPSSIGVAALRAWNRCFRRTELNPRPFLPLPGGSRVRHQIQRRVRVGRSIQESWGSVASAVASRYADSNSRLQELLSHDLRDLGYPIRCEGSPDA